MNKRLIIERKEYFEIEANTLKKHWKSLLNIDVPSLRYVLIYDVFNIDEDLLNKSLDGIFSDSNKDIILENIPLTKNNIVIEPLPGQFDQRADSAMQCLKLINPTSNAVVSSSIGYFFNEDVNIDKLTKYVLNPVESRLKNMSEFQLPKPSKPQKVKTVEGFISLSNQELLNHYSVNNLAMSFEDYVYVQSYFKSIKRNPTETEIKILDTYWSDHCRHTTFETELTNVTFTKDSFNEEIEKTFNDYLDTRNKLGINKPITLMDLAIINGKLERSRGNLDDLEISEEINAASIEIMVDVDGKLEPWMLMFKNETHNHPTEIEPFGGASTCIGGAIRDPLSGRSYVYGAMRITGAGDITAPIEETLEGKLPQSTISTEAAHGYSSYGNQIGLPTTYVEELFHPGYVAKRMEIGAVVGAIKKSHLRRETPLPGDMILVFGGRTGRDGIGGATGSSKSHKETSKTEAASEVQKGNAPEERKIQRLFRNKDVTKLIKKSNDFGAGGVSVAIGELAPGIKINLDKIKTKYDGINGTELAISESQERMSVVIDPKDYQAFVAACSKENIEVVHAADVTEDDKLIMTWNDEVICDIDRSFLDSAGVRQKQSVNIDAQITNFSHNFKGTLTEQINEMLEHPNVSDNKGLSEMFDASIGRTTVLNPYGGKTLRTKTQASIHLIPTLGKTNTASIMTYGFDPMISEKSPYLGSIYAVLESMAKQVAAGGNHEKIRFTFQEYFERLNKDKNKWGKPLSALLGAYKTLKAFNLAAIGGKDSMSGTYETLNVPPTLVSFAVSTQNVENIISPEFKEPNNYLYLVDYPLTDNLPDFDVVHDNFVWIRKGIAKKNIVSASAITKGGLAEQLIKNTFGNNIGISVNTDLPLLDKTYGSILVESERRLDYEWFHLLGYTTKDKTISINEYKSTIEDAYAVNTSRFDKVYPVYAKETQTISETEFLPVKPSVYGKKVDKVNVLFPIFPGTNCEYDSMAAFKHEKVNLIPLVFNNQTSEDIKASITSLKNAIDEAHIIMLSGGFSSGDEPDGSGKFIANVLRHELIREAIDTFLDKKHLILGICNGFQALLQSGLLPFGKVTDANLKRPILHKNTINRHIATFVNTRVTSTASPWLSDMHIGDVHTIPVSHGEGNFYVTKEDYELLAQNNQIAFQYCDELGKVSGDPKINKNGSLYAVEGIVSDNGLILGKMGHSERYTENLFKNVHGVKEQSLFKNGINYFINGGN